MAISGLPRVRTELDPLLIVPSLAHHPIQANRQSPGHGHLGDLASPPHHQVKILAAPFRKTRTVTCAASTSRKRKIELPCLVICPSRRRFPLDSSNGTSPR